MLMWMEREKVFWVYYWSVHNHSMEFLSYISCIHSLY